MKFISLLIILLWIPASALAEETLTLERALTLAGKNDPALEQIESNAQALGEQAVADGQLPDPKVTLGVENYPLDNGSITRENMSKFVVGAQQAFPRGRTLAYKSRRTEAMAGKERFVLLDKRLQIDMAVRQAWLDLYYWQQAAKSIAESEQLLGKVIEATETLYSTGRQNAQDIVGAELELSVLQDKKVDIQRRIETARANLGQWIGDEVAGQGLPDEFPALPQVQPYESLESGLAAHPMVKMAEAMIAAEQENINIAQEQYKPGFNVGLKYGIRSGNFMDGTDRPDNISALVTFDVPLFTGDRQDKTLAASRYGESAARYRRDDVLRDLHTMLETEYANWQRLHERVRHYESTVTGKARENFEANLRAYREDLADFSSLMRAQVSELDARLQAIRLKTDQAKAGAALLYLQGGKS